MRRRQHLKYLGLAGIGIGALVGPGRFLHRRPYSVEVQSEAIEKEGPPNPSDQDPTFTVELDTLDDKIKNNSPAIVAIRASNISNEEANYVTGTPKPFGVLYAGDNLLWSNAYRRSSGVETKNREVVGGTDGGPSVTVPPGESVSDSYELIAGPGSYTIHQNYNPFEINGHEYKLKLEVS